MATSTGTDRFVIMHSANHKHYEIFSRNDLSFLKIISLYQFPLNHDVFATRERIRFHSPDCWYFKIKILFFKIHRTNSTFQMKTMRTPLKGANVLFYLKSKQCFVCVFFSFSFISISLSVARLASRSLFGRQTIITIKYKSEKNVWCSFP